MLRLIQNLRRAWVRRQLLNISRQLHELPRSVVHEMVYLQSIHAANIAALNAAWDEWHDLLTAEQKRLALKLANLGHDEKTTLQRFHTGGMLPVTNDNRLPLPGEYIVQSKTLTLEAPL